ncbi:unnamed protein product [Ostreobium quekettii]|uniref:Uncharacterized protein n=1 Tax=Ostreobium quekettii TaxID=121088 RepID=A0A8S1INB6_9CHLO|nr:unnamed protein product [Ostreobium quekettii]
MYVDGGFLLVVPREGLWALVRYFQCPTLGSLAGLAICSVLGTAEAWTPRNGALLAFWLGWLPSLEVQRFGFVLRAGCPALSHHLVRTPALWSMSSILASRGFEDPMLYSVYLVLCGSFCPAVDECFCVAFVQGYDLLARIVLVMC